MSNTDIYKALQLKAIHDYLLRQDGYSYRKICRDFSKRFHTPLKEVYQLPMDFMLQNYYESNLEEMEFNEVFDIAIKDYLPELGSKEDEDAKEFAKELEKEQRRSLEKKKAKKNKEAKQQSLNKQEDKKTVGSNKHEPKSVNLKFDEESD